MRLKYLFPNSYDIADYSIANQHNTLQNDIAPQALKGTQA